MRLRSLTLTVLMAVAIASAGFFTAKSAAAVLSSGFSQFGSWTALGTPRCVSHKSTYFDSSPPNYEDSGYGYTRSRSGSPCDNEDSRPPGHMGVDVFVIKGDGNICGATGGWVYNVDPTWLLQRGVLAGCPNAQQHRAVSRSRVWRTTTDTWVISDYILSPWSFCSEVQRPC